MAAEPRGTELNMEQRSRSQSIHGIGGVASETAGSSAPYFWAIDARICMAFTPAALLTVHLPLLSNHCTPAWSRIGLTCIVVHCAACIANLNPWRSNLSPFL